MSKANVTVGDSGIFDAKQLGVSKMLILGVQHMFAMFGATVIVPAGSSLRIRENIQKAMPQPYRDIQDMNRDDP